MQTSPYNILQYFTAVKMYFSYEKKNMFFLLCSKHRSWVLSTKIRKINEPQHEKTNNVDFDQV